MIRLYPEQLVAHLQNSLCAVYLLAGNDPLLLQESQDVIYASARQREFSERHSWQIDNNTPWQDIFSCCTALSLFASRQILILQLPENGVNAATGQQLNCLATLLHQDILLIIQLTRLNKVQQNSAWFSALSQHGALVTCQTPEHEHLPRWLAARAKQRNLQLDAAASQLLCYCYEGNLLALAQALERLALLWPDSRLTLPRVEQAVNDAAWFTPFHWTDALLAGKSKRALHTLNQLRQQGCEAIILLRTLQRELLQLVSLKRQMDNQPLHSLFDQQRIWKTRRTLLSNTLHRLSLDQLRLAVCLLSRCELTAKQEFSSDIWQQLISLSLLLTKGQLAEVFIN